MHRRAFLGTLAGGLLAAPRAADAQQPRVYRVGVVLQGGPYLGAVDGLRKGLGELGLEEGKQFILHVREGKGDLKAVEEAAKDLEREKVDLIYSVATSVTLVVKGLQRLFPLCSTSVAIQSRSASSRASGNPEGDSRVPTI